MIWKECKSLIVSDLERLTNINKWGGGGGGGGEQFFF